MRATALVHGLLEILKQFFLPRAQIDRRFDHHPAHQITDRPTAHGFDTLATQTEQFAGLRFGRNFQYDFAI